MSARIITKNEPVTLIDAGTGNLRSVRNALESLGARVITSSDPSLIQDSRKLILPGVGAFGDFMRGMRHANLDSAVLKAVENGCILLGICVGMQALFEIGEEHGVHVGLGILKGTVRKFPEIAGLKIPQTGWNQLKISSESNLFKGIRNDAFTYFNHSYYCDPMHADTISAFTEYGIRYASAVETSRVLGVQFHPEKSQAIGLKILSNFLNI